MAARISRCFFGLRRRRPSRLCVDPYLRRCPDRKKSTGRRGEESGQKNSGREERRRRRMEEGRRGKSARARARATPAEIKSSRDSDVCLFDIHSPLQPTLFASPAAATDLTR